MKNVRGGTLERGKAQEGRWRFLLQAPLLRHAPDGGPRNPRRSPR